VCNDENYYLAGDRAREERRELVVLINWLSKAIFDRVARVQNLNLN
jgi:hypothetical protein